MQLAHESNWWCGRCLARQPLEWCKSQTPNCVYSQPRNHNIWISTWAGCWGRLTMNLDKNDKTNEWWWSQTSRPHTENGTVLLTNETLCTDKCISVFHFWDHMKDLGNKIAEKVFVWTSHLYELTSWSLRWQNMFDSYQITVLIAHNIGKSTKSLKTALILLQALQLNDFESTWARRAQEDLQFCM
jgi:hypothetical protein